MAFLLPFLTAGGLSAAGALGAGLTNKVGKKLGIFKKGGVVKGPIGSPQLAVVHGGEYVIPNRVMNKIRTMKPNNAKKQKKPVYRPLRKRKGKK